LYNFLYIFRESYSYFLSKAHKIDHAEELRQKPTATGPVCPVEDCKNASSVACENRFCEYAVIVDFYLFTICLKLVDATKNFYAYWYGVMNCHHGR
jgi:hypothetical protein